jgi:hypothetical protein
MLACCQGPLSRLLLLLLLLLLLPLLLQVSVTAFCPIRPA